jgi:hypothetical protein
MHEISIKIFMFQTVSMPTSSLRGATSQLADQLEAGHVYRREDLARLSNAIDRHLRELVSLGKLQKLAQGLYHAPKQSNFGPLPPADTELVKGFLRDKEFLVFSRSSYNVLGLGTTQLYNQTLVYNHKRHGVFRLGNRQFDFRVKPRFPMKLSRDFLYVDLLNNLQEIAEDRDLVLSQARSKLSSFGMDRLQHFVESYGNMATRKLFREWIDG